MARVVAMLPVRNEADRWLKSVLEQLSQIADAIVVYDDASDDGTSDLCRQYPKVHSYRGDVPWFGQNESELRRHLWDLAVLHEPEWLLALDADELLEDGAVLALPWLIDQSDYDAVAFRIFDFWNSAEHVRIDGAWNPWNRFSALLSRYDSTLDPAWLAQPIHCGRFPVSYHDRVTFYSPWRVRHYGWARAEDHLKKYLFYRERDMGLYGRVLEHTDSVIASTVTLEPWIELPIPSWLRTKERI